jgi:hypothetical protein
MKYHLAVVILLATLVLVAVGWLQTAKVSGVSLHAQSTPENAVQNLLRSVRERNWPKAQAQLANASQVDSSAFIYELAGGDGSLRTYSALEASEVSVLHQTADDALVRAKLNWSTAVGHISDTRDLKVIRDGNDWKVVWPDPRVPRLPAQVMSVNYLRWDIVNRGPEGEWGTASIDPPKVRIISMNAVERPDSVMVTGEVVDEDTIPVYVNVDATLIDAKGLEFREESSFDKVSHILLPSQVTPYRIDFPQVQLSHVKEVRMSAKGAAVPASADPVIGVMNQRLVTDALGRKLLAGELVNQSGQTVNIAHVLATFYDTNGKVIWVSDGYVDQALLPMTPQPFAVDAPADVAARAQRFRVIVNQYTRGTS